MTQIYATAAEGDEQEYDSEGSYFDGGSESDIDVGDFDIQTTASQDAVSKHQDNAVDLAAFQASRLAELNINHPRSTPTASSSPIQAFLAIPPLIERLLRNAVLSMADVKCAALVSHAFVVPARSVLFSRRSIAFHTPSQISRALDVFENKPEITSLIREAVISFADLFKMLLETEEGKRTHDAIRNAQDQQEPTYFWKGPTPDLAFTSNLHRQGPTVEGPQPWLLEVQKRVGKRASGDVIEAGRLAVIRSQICVSMYCTNLHKLKQELSRLYSDFAGFRYNHRTISYTSFPPLLDRLLGSTWFKSLRQLKLSGPAAAMAVDFLPYLGAELESLEIEGELKATPIPDIDIKVVHRSAPLIVRSDSGGLAGNLVALRHLQVRNKVFSATVEDSHELEGADAPELDSSSPSAPSTAQLPSSPRPWLLQSLRLSRCTPDPFTIPSPLSLYRFVSTKATLTALHLSSCSTLFSASSIFETILAHSGTLTDLVLKDMFPSQSAAPDYQRREASLDWSAGSSSGIESVPWVVRKQWALATGEPVPPDPAIRRHPVGREGWLAITAPEPRVDEASREAVDLEQEEKEAALLLEEQFAAPPRRELTLDFVVSRCSSLQRFVLKEYYPDAISVQPEEIADLSDSDEPSETEPAGKMKALPPTDDPSSSAVPQPDSTLVINKHKLPSSSTPDLDDDARTERAVHPPSLIDALFFSGAPLERGVDLFLLLPRDRGYTAREWERWNKRVGALKERSVGGKGERRVEVLALVRY